MDKFVEVCGTPIEIKSIKDFRIVQKEYIYRPVFTELPKKNFLSSVKYKFEKMEPYASIQEEKEVGLPFLGNKVKKYHCVNAAGRKMFIALNEVPVLVYHPDGHAAEVFHTNPNYKLMEKDKSACIEMVETLVIQAKEKYVFYGNNIHLFSVLDAYNRVKDAVVAYGTKPEKKKKEDKAEHDEFEKNEYAEEPKVKSDDNSGSGKDVGSYAKNLFGIMKNTVGSVKDTIGNKMEEMRDKNSSSPVDATSSALPSGHDDLDNGENEEEMDAASEKNSTDDKTGEELRELKGRFSRGEITLDEYTEEVSKVLARL